MNHGDVYPRQTRLRQLFVIFSQPSAPTQPSECSFNHPPAWQHFELMAVFRPLHNLQKPASETTSPIHQLSSIATVSPDQLKPRKSLIKLGQYELCSITILNVCPVNHHRHEQSYSVNNDLALAPVDLLSCIIAPWPPLSVVFTDWLSMIPALGVDSRPSICLTFGHKASSIRSQVP